KLLLSVGGAVLQLQTFASNPGRFTEVITEIQVFTLDKSLAFTVAAEHYATLAEFFGKAASLDAEARLRAEQQKGEGTLVAGVVFPNSDSSGPARVSGGGGYNAVSDESKERLDEIERRLGIKH